MRDLRSDRRPRTSATLLSVALLSTCGCALLEPGDAGSSDGAPSLEVGDLPQIVERGQLRVLITRRSPLVHLPRGRSAVTRERELAEGFARALGVEPVWVTVDSREQLITSLLAGKGDLVAGNVAVTEGRRRVAAFTVPVALLREQVVGRADEPPLADASELRGRRLALRASSPAWRTARQLLDAVPGIELERVPEAVDAEEILHRVAIGRYDLTIADSNLVEAFLEYRTDVRPLLDLGSDRTVAWAVRPHSEELLDRLNHYLNEAQLAYRSGSLHRDDLPAIAERKVLRMLTTNTAATYFLYRGELKGFEYELMQHFARSLGLRLEVVVPPEGDDLLRWLREGRGDIVAAGLQAREERSEDGIAFTRPYDHVSQVVVTRADDPRPIEAPADLADRRVFVRREGPAWDALRRLRDDGVALALEEVAEPIQTEQIIARVAAGEYDVTLAESHVLGIELHWRDDVRAALELEREIPLAWAVREDNPELLRAANAFLDAEYRGLQYNILYRRYFLDEKRVRRHVAQRDLPDVAISPYDDVLRRYAAMYGFDWRLIAAQMYQESQFRPDARSFAGAQGLMQVLPTTGLELGFTDLDDPEQAVHAGVKYLDWVRDQFAEELPVEDRTWFSLAAYNAGIAHVEDARRLARRVGLNPDRWFGNVEQAMLLLALPQYASTVPHGYCRCREPVNYVREIRARYRAYVDVMKAADVMRSRAALPPRLDRGEPS